MNNQVFQQVLNALAERRREDEREEQRRRREVVEKCPEIGQLMDARREAVMKSVYSAFSIAPEEGLAEKVERWNADIKDLLVKSGFSADYLDPVFTCAQCEDTGYIGRGKKTLCSCAKALYASLLEEEKGFEDSQVAVVYARQMPAKDTGETEKFTRRFNYPDNSRRKTINDLEQLGIKTYFASNVCCAYDRGIYNSLGGFIESAVFNEDMIYTAGALKAGYAAVYQAEAKVIHAHNYTAMQQLHRNFDLGMSQEMHPEVFEGVPSEGEGVKLVRETMKHLARTGHGLEIPKLIYHSGCKYIGYRLGKAWRRLPRFAVKRLAMNKSFVAREQGDRPNG